MLQVSGDAAWESADVPSFDYTAWSTDLQATMSGIHCVRQCLLNTKTVLPLLKEITSRDFFSYYAVTLITPCMYAATLELCPGRLLHLQRVGGDDGAAVMIRSGTSRQKIQAVSSTAARSLPSAIAMCHQRC